MCAHINRIPTGFAAQCLLRKSNIWTVWTRANQFLNTITWRRQMLSRNRSKLQPRFTQCQGHADQRKKSSEKNRFGFELRISIFLKECKYKTVLYLLSLNIYTKVWTHTNQLLYQKTGSFAHWKCRMRSTWKSYPEPCTHVGISGKTNAEILPKRNKRLLVMRGKEKEHVYENHWE